jgi:hypothetical protein
MRSLVRPVQVSWVVRRQEGLRVAEVVAIAGWLFLGSIALGVLGSLGLAAARLFIRSRPPQIVGAELPATDAGIDLTKRYDIVYGAGHAGVHEKLSGVRILGYLRSDRDETTGEYIDSRWLVVEMSDGRRAYLRPRSVLWLLEAADAEPGAAADRRGT